MRVISCDRQASSNSAMLSLYRQVFQYTSALDTLARAVHVLNALNVLDSGSVNKEERVDRLWSIQLALDTVGGGGVRLHSTALHVLVY